EGELALDIRESVSKSQHRLLEQLVALLSTRIRGHARRFQHQVRSADLGLDRFDLVLVQSNVNEAAKYLFVLRSGHCSLLSSKARFCQASRSGSGLSGTPAHMNVS